MNLENKYVDIWGKGILRGQKGWKPESMGMFALFKE
jgi:hypothetical protein